ncbi:MAG: integron integrase [Gammaproteobacteria bacterium]|jgi:integron integrase
MDTQFTPKSARLMDLGFGILRCSTDYIPVVEVKETLRFHHYAYSTEKTYIHWILRYIRFNNRSHPKDMGKHEIKRFLSHLAINRDVSASTQNQALNAILFLYKHVLKLPVDMNIRAIRSDKQKRLPTVLSKQEIQEIFIHLSGVKLLMVKLMYAAGLRVTELHDLRVQNFDFDNNQLYIRDSKGGKDRISLLPKTLHEGLKRQIESVKSLHQQDLNAGYGEVSLPNALARKYPNAGKTLGWQFIFPSTKLSADPRNGLIQRYHIHISVIRKAIKVAVTKTNINKRVTTHVFRHSFATHLLEDGINIRMVQTLLGHKDVKTTEIYTHVMDKSISGVMSPLEMLEKNIG